MQAKLPVADLHCDLLAYLDAKPGRTPRDGASRCSLPQLAAGGVAVQVLALFAITDAGSAERGTAQSHIFARLVEEHDGVVPLGDGGGSLQVVAALENASLFCEESEPLDDGLKRFEEIEYTVGRVLYVTLTWKDDNRFGGASGLGDVGDSAAGLKDDGRTFLGFLSGRGTAVDLSHASHALASDVLEYVEAKGLDVAVCASHSCFSALREIPRNLPDDVAREIFRRGGVVGLNFMRTFLGGDAPRCFADQVVHAWELGGKDGFCFGADFFADCDIPPERRLLAPDGFYFPDFGDASVYPGLLELLGRELGASEDELRGLAFGNFWRFVGRLEGTGR